MARLSNEVRIHLEKAMDSALLAVETYNRPGTKFRSGGFIVMMCIAWTALFHAIYFKRKTKPFYRKKENRRHFEIVDGDKKAWELSTCINKFWPASSSSPRANLEFFVGLRNKIEHRSMPALDISIFGECQALLFNFEDLLVTEFGSKHALGESLSLALQFSCMRNGNQEAAIRKLHKSLAQNIRQYVDTFRSTLSANVLGDLKFSYNVFLVPKPANHEKTADFAIEFVKFDPTKPEEMERYERIVSLIKPTGTVALNGMAVQTASTGMTTRDIRIVNDPQAPVFGIVDYDKTHPYIQKSLLKLVSGKIPAVKGFNQYDLLAVRRVHKTDDDPRFFHKGLFGAAQYSDAFANWLIMSYMQNNSFFYAARDAYGETVRLRQKGPSKRAVASVGSGTPNLFAAVNQ
jgi:hypothetical protein